MKLGWKLGGTLLATAVVAGLLPGSPAGAAALPAVATQPTAAPQRAQQALPRSVTLVTGDRVTIVGTDKVSVKPGAGRSGIRFLTRRSAGHLLVIPSDAAPLLRAGQLDQRLFDVDTLTKFRYDDRRKDVPLIITYSSAAKAKSGDTWTKARVTRALPSARGQAVRVNKKDAGVFWRALTGGGAAPKTLSAGAAKVWLDGIRQPSLDESVPQIGAPDAWQAGFTGTGVKVAVLDTGIDATHPDLADRVVAQQNFTEDPSNLDVVGHGTHVASTVAGSGAVSNGRYKGVATGAKLLDGKVCESFGCTESAILAGMEWGAQNAKVINMSLGGFDGPEIDPLEEAVTTLTAQYGTLFVIAAGNDGPGAATVGSPGSADAALTVGAVTKTNEMADFSSRGPRTGDHVIKPDVTAPGVDITAARSKDGEFGSPGESYTELSGTSMATPHTAGAAAILSQQHPTWTPQQLKSALMASAKAIANAGVLDQGAGRVDLTRAIKQSVIATPGSASFGLQQWPHGDDTPVSKTLGYHNFGAGAVTLNLAVSSTGPGGIPAPAGMFQLSSPTLTVPAGGDASVTVTANTATASPDGLFGGYLTATAGTQSVRTPIAVEKEVESYNVKLIQKNRSGQVTGLGFTTLWDYGFNFFFNVVDPDGVATLRVPKGRYLLSSVIFGSDPDVLEATMLAQPTFVVNKNQTVVLDARLAKPVSVSVPQPAAKGFFHAVGFTATGDEYGFGSDLLIFDELEGAYAGQLGSQQPVSGFTGTVSSTFADPGSAGDFSNSRFVYTLFWYEKGRFFNGLTRHVAESDLATVREDFARHASGSSGDRFTFPIPPVEAGGWAAVLPFDLPSRRTTYFNSDKGTKWAATFSEVVPSSDPEFPFPTAISEQVKPAANYQAGKSYAEQWNRGVFGPVLAARTYPQQWATRTGNEIYAGVPLYGDGAGHVGYSRIDSGKTTLFRNGKKIAAADDTGGVFPVPGPKAQYRLQVQSNRSAPFSLSTRISTAWTFKSGHVYGESPAALPLSVVRFTPELSKTSTAPGGRKFTLPIAVQRQPGAPAATTESLTVEVSYDDGATWKTVKMSRNGEKWTAELTHPNKPGFVSLRAKATDTAGNTVEQTIIRAYRITAYG